MNNIVGNDRIIVWGLKCFAMNNAPISWYVSLRAYSRRGKPFMDVIHHIEWTLQVQRYDPQSSFNTVYHIITRNSGHHVTRIYIDRHWDHPGTFKFYWELLWQGYWLCLHWVLCWTVPMVLLCTWDRWRQISHIPVASTSHSICQLYKVIMRDGEKNIDA